MSGKKLSITQTEFETIFDALKDAEDWQFSLADAHHNRGPYAEKAQAKFRRYKRLRSKIAKHLGLSMTNALEDAIADAQEVGLKELPKVAVLHGIKIDTTPIDEE